MVNPIFGPFNPWFFFFSDEVLKQIQTIYNFVTFSMCPIFNMENVFLERFPNIFL